MRTTFIITFLTYAVKWDVGWQHKKMGGRGSRYTKTVKSERQLIVKMWMDGSSAHVISRTTGISVSTVHRWIRRWREECSIETRPYTYNRKWITPISYTYTRFTLSANLLHKHLCSLPLCYFLRT